MPAGEVLISEGRIRERVAELAREIDAALPPGSPHAVITLKGALFFGADLIRALNREATLGFITAASYGEGTESGGEVRLGLEWLGDLAGRDVLLIDDILDTGRTFQAAVEAVRARRPASLRTCVLLEKPSRRRVALRADHVGFSVEDVFVVGYGLDCGEAFRTLPDIRALRPAGEEGGRERGGKG